MRLKRSARIFLELPCVADAELEPAGTAIEFIVFNGNAVIETKRADREVQTKAETPVIGVRPVNRPWLLIHLADIIKYGEAHANALFLVLLENRHAVFQ